jgi:hypothetical protein
MPRTSFTRLLALLFGSLAGGAIWHAKGDLFPNATWDYFLPKTRGVGSTNVAKNTPSL